jgi:hypothetical protein
VANLNLRNLDTLARIEGQLGNQNVVPLETQRIIELGNQNGTQLGDQRDGQVPEDGHDIANDLVL